MEGDYRSRLFSTYDATHVSHLDTEDYGISMVSIFQATP
jgi:hypothetical protein